MIVTVKYTLLIITVGLVLVGSNSEPCNLENGAAGQCRDINLCPFQIGKLRVGASVETCENSSPQVCCPTSKSISETKCEQWRQMLFAPHSFDQPGFGRIQCAARAGVPLLVSSGTDAFPFEYPHVVALGYGSEVADLQFGCAATIISESYLLTAAHCVMHRLGKPSHAIIGERVLLKPPVQRGIPYQNLVHIADHIIHPEYEPPRIYHDIAILRLSTQLSLDRYVLPACISTPLKAPRANSSLEACGWGLQDGEASPTSSILQVANITTLGPRKCNKIYEDAPDKHVKYPHGLLKSQICATGEDERICRSDSGGGVYVREQQCLFHVVGITSIESKHCGLGSPSVYTNVASYQDWIESTVWGENQKPR